MNKRDFIAFTVASIVMPVAAAKAAKSSNPVTLDYNLGKHGWSSFKLHVGAKTVEVGTFSYTTNALDDFVDAALLLAGGENRVEISLDGEPNEWRIIVDEGSMPDMHLRILSFPDIYQHSPESLGRLEFEARVKRDDFARAVQAATHKIWDRYGAEGYVKTWGGSQGFPLAPMRALDAALSAKTN